ncbi:hypothetical protein GW17_00013102 [Ensete ventricosum]|nr:hypothetical protein GW17_00013102 [Ensete ventricosum]
MFIARFAISTCIARYGQYILVRQVTDTRTVGYRAVPSKIDRQRSISAIGDRLREKSIVDGRLRKKKGRRRGKEKKKKRGRKNTSPSRRPRLPAGRLRTVAARGHGRFFSRARRRSVSPCGETNRGDIAEGTNR